MSTSVSSALRYDAMLLEGLTCAMAAVKKDRTTERRGELESGALILVEDMRYRSGSFRSDARNGAPEDFRQGKGWATSCVSVETAGGQDHDILVREGAFVARAVLQDSDDSIGTCGDV